MKRLLILCSICSLMACTGNREADQKAEQAAQEQVKTDQERMDSMDRAIQQQMQAVSDDSVLNAVQE